MNIKIAIAAMMSASSQLAQASVCEPYVGQVVATVDIDDAMAPFKAIGPKGEFEPTAQYEARKQDAISKLGNILIVRKTPEDRKHIIYDADTQRLNIVTYAFHNTGLNSDALFGYGAPYEGQMGKGYSNIEVVIEEDETVTERYKASNSYGAETVISKLFRRTRGIFQSKVSSPKRGDLFPNAAEKPYYAGSISMTPEDAMRLKPSLQLAFVVVPKPPYFLSALYDYPARPTVARPFEVTNEVSALIADFQCGLVLDPENRVIGAFETD